jgi:EAL domain-containing protein (putative c-di-GMP-specific phosphodiesterase class I)
MMVIAEGVETKAQLDFLRSLSCDVYQGYLGGRPIDAGRFEALIK